MNRFFALCLLLLFLPGAGWSADDGKMQLLFDGWDGPNLRVFLTRPTGLAPDRPVVFVMHGMGRNADEYRDQWHELAVANDFLLVVPEFSEADFPGTDAYNLGNLSDTSGAPTPRGRW